MAPQTNPSITEQAAPHVPSGINPLGLTKLSTDEIMRLPLDEYYAVVPDAFDWMLPDDPRWTEEMHRRFGVFTADELRSDSTWRKYAHSFSEKQLWLNTVADRLEASGHRRLDEVPIEQASSILAR